MYLVYPSHSKKDLEESETSVAQSKLIIRLNNLHGNYHSEI